MQTTSRRARAWAADLGSIYAIGVESRAVLLSSGRAVVGRNKDMAGGRYDYDTWTGEDKYRDDGTRADRGIAVPLLRTHHLVHLQVNAT